MNAEAPQGNASIVSRLVELLLRQKEKFEQYLDVLRQEAKSIESGETEKLRVQLELENVIISEIRALRRSIEPLEDLRRSTPERADASIRALKAGLARMGEELKRLNAANRAALKTRMEGLAGEIAGLRAWPRPAAAAVAAPSLIDITA